MSVSIETQVVQAARSWIGTPYRHQASVKQAGCDCLGLVRGVWRDLYGSEPEPIPHYSRDWSEPQGHEALWQGAARNLIPKAIEDVAHGDVLLFRLKETGVAKHLGIAAELGQSPRFIHAYSGHAVVESPFSLPWRRRLVARFAFPQLTESKGEF